MIFNNRFPLQFPVNVCDSLDLCYFRAAAKNTLTICTSGVVTALIFAYIMLFILQREEGYYAVHTPT